MKYLTFLFLLFAQPCFGQSKALSKVINNIDYHQDTVKAVYDWITNNIRYDIAKFKQVDKGENLYKKGNYKNVDEFRADQLEKVIKRKKGVCEDYTILFEAIMNALGYESFRISGITKGPKGKLNRSSGHSWIAIKDRGEWKLCDPTWGAGQVKDGKKFIQKYNPKWYNVDPEIMKERHYPFDPIWQLSDDPMTFNEFKKGAQLDDENPAFDFNAVIDNYMQKSDKERMTDELARMEATEDGEISLIRKRKKSLQSKISTNDIPSIIEQCRASANQFNEYILEGKNKGFRGDKWTLEYSKNTLIDIKAQIEESIVAFDNVKVKSAKAKKGFKKNIAQSKKLLQKVEEELEYLESKS
ncbi:MAG: transglutaminase-like domain-containing protein [Bacteroidota bacterium]